MLLIFYRELRNKETRIDLSVPDFHEVSGLLSNDEVFHIIVISSLPYFKTIKHKKDDTVQFMVSTITLGGMGGKGTLIFEDSMYATMHGP